MATTTESLKTKTFGIENQIILQRVGLASPLWILTPLFIALLEIYYEGQYPVKSTKKSGESAFLVLCHYLVFMYLETFLFTFLLSPRRFGKIRKYTIWIWGFTAIFKVFYLYNPWISDCYENAYPHLKYFMFFIHTFAPVALFVHVFVTIIYWRMSKEEREYSGEESYEDICQSEKMLENE